MKEKILESEFVNYENEHSRAAKKEWLSCVEPRFVKYKVGVQEFLLKDVYPTYRLNTLSNKLTGDYKDKNAIPITFRELAKRPELLLNLLREGYISTNDTVIAYHCETCDLWVIKDGIHRLSHWVSDGSEKTILVYEVICQSWFGSTIDMPNFCKCR